MSTANFRIALDGDIPLDVFTDSLNAWRESLNAAAELAGASMDAQWFVTELSHGTTNVGVTMHASSDAQSRAIEGTVVAMGTALKRGYLGDLPSRMEEWARQLAVAVSKDDGYSMTLSTSDTDVLILPNTLRTVTESPMVSMAPLLRSPSMTSYGRVEGRIQTLSSRDSLRFTLYDSLWDKAVTCYIRNDQHALLEDKWDKYAFVEGRITRDRETGRPLGIRDISDVRIVEERTARDGPLPGRGALRGVIDTTKLPEEYVRNLRDE